MSNLARRHVLLATAFVLLLLAGPGCKTSSTAAPPPAAPAAVAAAPVEMPAPAPALAAADLALQAPAAAVGAVAMSLRAASPPTLIADLDALSSRLGLPMPLGQALIPALTSGPGPGGVPLSPELFGRLDPARPLAVIWMTASPGAPAGWCAAITFKDGGLARQTLGEFGTVSGQAGAASQLRTPAGETAWAGVQDRTVLLANSNEVLLAGGAWALAEQREAMPGQVVFTIRPQVLARPTGKPIESLVAAFLDEMTSEMEKAASTSAGKTLTPASRKMVNAAFKLLARPVAELAAVRVIADVAAERGVLLRAELEPLPGSAFAQRSANTAPFALDPALAMPGESLVLLAWGDLASLGAWTEVMEASGPAGRTAARDFSTFFGQTVRAGACTLDLGASPISSLCSMDLRPGVPAPQALARYLALLQSSNAWGAELEGRQPVPIKVKRARGTIELQTRIENKDPRAQAMMKSLLGGDVISGVLAVKDGHLVQAVGPKPLKVLARYGAKPGEAPGPIVGRTVSEAQGADCLGVLDLASLALKVFSHGQDPTSRQAAMMMAAIPGMPELRVPMAFTMRGGSLTSFDLRVPLGSLKNVARVVRASMGVTGGCSDGAATGVTGGCPE